MYGTTGRNARARQKYLTFHLESSNIQQKAFQACTRVFGKKMQNFLAQEEEDRFDGK